MSICVSEQSTEKLLDDDERRNDVSSFKMKGDKRILVEGTETVDVSVIIKSDCDAISLTNSEYARNLTIKETCKLLVDSANKSEGESESASTNIGFVSQYNDTAPVDTIPVKTPDNFVPENDDRPEKENGDHEIPLIDKSITPGSDKKSKKNLKHVCSDNSVNPKDKVNKQPCDTVTGSFPKSILFSDRSPVTPRTKKLVRFAFLHEDEVETDANILDPVTHSSGDNSSISKEMDKSEEISSKTRGKTENENIAVSPHCVVTEHVDSSDEDEDEGGGNIDTMNEATPNSIPESPVSRRSQSLVDIARETLRNESISDGKVLIPSFNEVTEETLENKIVDTSQSLTPLVSSSITKANNVCKELDLDCSVAQIYTPNSSKASVRNIEEPALEPALGFSPPKDLSISNKSIEKRSPRKSGTFAQSLLFGGIILKSMSGSSSSPCKFDESNKMSTCSPVSPLAGKFPRIVLREKSNKPRKLKKHLGAKFTEDEHSIDPMISFSTSSVPLVKEQELINVRTNEANSMSSSKGLDSVKTQVNNNVVLKTAAVSLVKMDENVLMKYGVHVKGMCYRDELKENSGVGLHHKAIKGKSSVGNKDISLLKKSVVKASSEDLKVMNSLNSQNVKESNIVQKNIKTKTETKSIPFSSDVSESYSSPLKKLDVNISESSQVHPGKDKPKFSKFLSCKGKEGMKQCSVKVISSNKLLKQRKDGKSSKHLPVSKVILKNFEKDMKKARIHIPKLDHTVLSKYGIDSCDLKYTDETKSNGSCKAKGEVPEMRKVTKNNDSSLKGDVKTIVVSDARTKNTLCYNIKLKTCSVSISSLPQDIIAPKHILSPQKNVLSQDTGQGNLEKKSPLTRTANHGKKISPILRPVSHKKKISPMHRPVNHEKKVLSITLPLSQEKLANHEQKISLTTGPVNQEKPLNHEKKLAPITKSVTYETPANHEKEVSQNWNNNANSAQLQNIAVVKLPPLNNLVLKQNMKELNINRKSSPNAKKVRKMKPWPKNSTTPKHLSQKISPDVLVRKSNVLLQNNSDCHLKKAVICLSKIDNNELLRYGICLEPCFIKGTTCLPDSQEVNILKEKHKIENKLVVPQEVNCIPSKLTDGAVEGSRKRKRSLSDEASESVPLDSVTQPLKTPQVRVCNLT